MSAPWVLLKVTLMADVFTNCSFGGSGIYIIGTPVEILNIASYK